MANYRKSLYYIVSPATGSTPGNFFRLRWQHFLHWTSPAYWLKVPITALVTLIFAPFNWYERLVLRKRLAETKVHESPIFIIGHWRSGTTHLHNLLSKDERFGFTSNVQCLFPNSFMTNPLVKVFLKVFMPKTRPMDNMKLELGTPQEDELAVANVSPFSFYNTWMHPRTIWKDYKRYVRFEGATPRQTARWKRRYMYLLKKATLNSGGGRLVLKNPAHTARIPLLLELFPKAKFIFLYRHPVTVFYSTRRLYLDAMPQFAFQKIKEEQMDREIFRIYQNLMESYLSEKKMVPAENLMEIRFEDLERDRMGILEKIYEELDLGAWDEAGSNISEYLGTIMSYKKNVHQYSAEEISQVHAEWSFAFEELGYAPEPEQ